MVVVLYDFEYFICFLLVDVYNDSEKCLDANRYVRPILACIPSTFRLLRYIDTGHAWPHVANMGKYATTYLVVGMSSWYGANENVASITCYALALAFATIYKLFWDYKKDWDVLNCNVEPILLREKRLYPTASYYLSIVSNFILRVSQAFTFSPEGLGVTFSKVLFLTIFAVAEVFRRFVWNFFRVENEQLSNCGQFRILPDVPKVLTYERERPEDSAARVRTVKSRISRVGKNWAQSLSRTLGRSGGSVLRSKTTTLESVLVDEPEDESHGPVLALHARSFTTDEAADRVPDLRGRSSAKARKHFRPRAKEEEGASGVDTSETVMEMDMEESAARVLGTRRSQSPRTVRRPSFASRKTKSVMLSQVDKTIELPERERAPHLYVLQDGKSKGSFKQGPGSFVRKATAGHLFHGSKEHDDHHQDDARTGEGKAGGSAFTRKAHSVEFVEPSQGNRAPGPKRGSSIHPRSVDMGDGRSFDSYRPNL